MRQNFRKSFANTNTHTKRKTVDNAHLSVLHYKDEKIFDISKGMRRVEKKKYLII